MLVQAMMQMISDVHACDINIKIQCVSMLFKIFKPFISMISLSLTTFKCLFGELEKHLYNDYMIVSRWLTMGKTKKVWTIIHLFDARCNEHQSWMEQIEIGIK